MSALKRCSKCKLATYCSEQCQKEHWHNTHKNHCKYISKKKVLATATHDNSACVACKEESQAGKEMVSEACSSALPCTMSPANIQLTNLRMFDSFYGYFEDMVIKTSYGKAEDVTPILSRTVNK